MQKIMIKSNDLDFRTKEAYKTLRSNIEFSGQDIRTIAITSSTPNEGKSEVAFELARTFAQADKKVLLIDADLRKSVMREHFKNGKVRFGLTNFLIGHCKIDDCMCQTDEPGLYVIFSGPSTPMPSELLGGQIFSQLLKESHDVFDVIIIDTPPLGSVIDAAIVGKQCDGTVLVVASGRISYRFTQIVLTHMRKAGCHVLGAVINMVSMGGNRYYGKYYGRYYGKYYGKYYGDYGNYG
jgi:capsular exopolysaccharide synthesis family protein